MLPVIGISGPKRMQYIFLGFCAYKFDFGISLTHFISFFPGALLLHVAKLGSTSLTSIDVNVVNGKLCSVSLCPC